MDSSKAYTDADFQDYVYSAIQQSNQELQELQELVIDPFVKRNGDSEIQFEDYARHFELQKLVSAAHTEVRTEAKRLLLTTPMTLITGEMLYAAASIVVKYGQKLRDVMARRPVV